MSGAGYVEPASPTVYLKGRVDGTAGNGSPEIVQEIEDAGAHSRLDALAALLAARATEATAATAGETLAALLAELETKAGRLDRQPTRDDFTDGEALDDQIGSGGVLTFTFTSPVNLVWVRSVGGVARCDPFGGAPSATRGVYCADDEPAPITVNAESVAVFAPAGATVSVWGFRY